MLPVRFSHSNALDQAALCIMASPTALANASIPFPGFYFTLGDTRFQFHMLKDKKATKQALAIADSDPSLAMLCLNDDVEADQEDVNETLKAWFNKRWPRAASWEK